MARQRPGVGGGTPEARAAASIGRRLLRAALTGGASLALELKLLLVGIAVVAVAVCVLCFVMAMVGGKANALAGSGVTPTPAPDCDAAAANAPPANLMPIYQAASDRYQLGEQGWSVLAAINRIETDFGRNLSVSSADAKGWMQFIDDTWRSYGVDGDNDGRLDVYDPEDAIHSAANLLKASGAPGDWYRAIFAYNHADWYVQDVLRHAEQYRGECSTQSYAPPGTTPGMTAARQADGTALAPEGAPESVTRVIAAANQIANKPYEWGGGHGGWADDGYDCSGLTSYALHGAGLLDTVLDSSGFESWGDAGPGTWVTIYANAEHVFMIVAGLRLDSGGSGRVGSAWRAADLTRSRSFANFVVRHPPGL